MSSSLRGPICATQETQPWWRDDKKNARTDKKIVAKSREKKVDEVAVVTNASEKDKGSTYVLIAWLMMIAEF